MTNDLSLDHRRHDALLIAAHAAGDLVGRDAECADTLVRDCADCGRLATDLRALAAATQQLHVPKRPRDFTLQPADAARLRPAGWRRFIPALRGDGLRAARPIGAGLATLGFAGLVFASTVGGSGSPGIPLAAAGAPAASQEVAAAGEPATPVTDAGTLAGGAAASPGRFGVQLEIAGAPEPEPAQDGVVDSDGSAARGTPAAANPNEAMIVVSGSMFIVGIGLFGLRWTASRLPD